MKLFLYLFIILLSLSPCRSQAQYENVWAFGNNAGLDFNSGSPVPIQTGIQGFGEANASVCDAAGGLLFCTEGSYIWDRNGNLMPNGSDLTPFTSPTLPVTASSSQGTVIVPFPGQSHRFFVFSITNVEMAGNFGRLYYSIVDMTLNGGLGDVVPGAKGIFVTSGLNECLTAVVGDRCNVWLITYTALGQQFRAFEITAGGLNAQPVISPAGGSATGGYIAVSPDRKHLALGTSGSYGAIVYDFNAVSGTMSDPIPLLPFTGCPGTCFSPDSKKLYVIGMGNLYQFDISSGDPGTIANTQVVLNNSGMMGSHLRRAPDNKIYFRTPGSSTRMGAIHNPNGAGAACNIQLHVLDLTPATDGGIGLPNTVAFMQTDSLFTTQAIAAPCFAGSVTISALNDTAGWDYVWNNGSTGASLEAGDAGTHWVSYRTPPCIYHTDTFIVSFPNGRLPALTIDTACTNTANGGAEVAGYSGDTMHYTYIWTTGAGDTLATGTSLDNVRSGSYVLRVHTAVCDTAINISVPEAGYQVDFSADSIVCTGDAIVFQNNSPAQFSIFYWQFGDGATSQTEQASHVYQEPGSYEVILTGSGNICTDTLRKTIIADPRQDGFFLCLPDRACTGDAITFQPDTDSTVVSLRWTWDDSNSLTVPAEPSTTHAFGQAGTFPILLQTNYRACPPTTYTRDVHIYALPNVYLGPDSGICLGGMPLILENLASLPASGYHYRWSTGDTTQQLKVVHPGTYSLTVTENTLGCNTTESVSIRKNCYIDVPNVFTPNDDGVNDYFFPRQLLSRKITRFRMLIWNRWGQIMFETSQTNGRGWDGNFNGKSQPVGVYLYMVEAEIDGRLTERYEGNVTLAR